MRQMFALIQLVIFVGILQIHGIDAWTNYCAKDLCSGDHKHIGCHNDGRFSRHCPVNARIIQLGPYRNSILAQHNSRRNLVAGGKFSHFLAARRMATMAWSHELAALAELNVKQCRMRHDACHNTNEFRASGQNLAYDKIIPGNCSLDRAVEYKHNVRWTVRQLLDDFFAEYKHIKMPGMRKYPKHAPKNSKIFSHFTVMVSDHNTHVGCAAAEYRRNATTTFLLACNYARTNLIGRPVYAVGKPTQGCRTGPNHKYGNLCSRHEQYSVAT